MMVAVERGRWWRSNDCMAAEECRCWTWWWRSNKCQICGNRQATRVDVAEYDNGQPEAAQSDEDISKDKGNGWWLRSNNETMVTV